MPAVNAISSDKLARLIGTPACPAIIDVGADDGSRVPGSIRRPAANVAHWVAGLRAPCAVVVCGTGRDESPGVAAWLRQAGVDAELLQGGLAGWIEAGLPLIRPEVLPPRDEAGCTVWVTRSRPKVDRIACPWLIRRFVDPEAIFLFVAPTDVAGVASRFGATPFDVEGVFWSHRGENCTFDTMVEEFGLADFAPLARLAEIVRGADTARLDIAPQAAGLVAVSLGLSRMYDDDLEQLEAGMTIYDALYRWCRDAVDEVHDWVSHVPKAKTRP